MLTSERVAVGEQITLGRLYAGAALDWEAHPFLHVTVLALSNVLDPSAIFSVALAYEASSNTRVIAGGYVPAGASPRAALAPEPKSEFGLYPSFGFVELRVAL